MTTTQKQNIPALRFSEFRGEWNSLQLGDVATFSKGKGISKVDIEVGGSLECIRYGQLYTDYAETIRDIKSRTNIPENELVLSEANDIIIPASGETQIDIATASCVLKSGVALGGDLNIVKTKYDGVFLSYYLNSVRKIDIARLSQGISVVHLYSSQLKLLHLNLPRSTEQQKIASFLTSVDTKIEQLGKKKTLLEKYKKGMMQKLFNQEIRFKDEQGNDFPDWEKKSLGGIAESPSYGMNASAISFDGTHKYIRITDIDADNRKFKPSPLSSPSGEIGSEYRLEEGDILFARTGASTGRSYIYQAKDGEVYFAGFLIRFRISKACPKFIFFTTLMYDFEKWVVKMSMRSGQPGINAKEFSTYPIVLPSFKEQQKIANFLSALDKKIDLIATKLKQTQTFKKGLLQQMFM